MSGSVALIPAIGYKGINYRGLSFFYRQIPVISLMLPEHGTISAKEEWRTFAEYLNLNRHQYE